MSADTHPAEDARKVLTAHKAPISAWWGLSVRSNAVPGLKLFDHGGAVRIDEDPITPVPLQRILTQTSQTTE